MIDIAEDHATDGVLMSIDAASSLMTVDEAKILVDRFVDTVQDVFSS